MNCKALLASFDENMHTNRPHLLINTFFRLSNSLQDCIFSDF